jgi:hypothetical protein
VTNYRTIREVEEEYLRNHPEEIDDYLMVLFDEYAESGDAAALLSSLRVVSLVKGVNAPENENLQLGSVNRMLRAMGYRLTPQKLPLGQEIA